MSHVLQKRNFSPPRRDRRPPRGTNEFGIGAAAYPDGRIAVLLSRYPDISRAEFGEVLDFVRRARPAQLRRLRSSEAARRKLERFTMEQQRFIPTFRERVIWAAVALLMMLALSWLLWEIRPQPPTLAPIAELSSLAVALHGEAGGDA